MHREQNRRVIAQLGEGSEHLVEPGQVVHVRRPMQGHENVARREIYFRKPGVRQHADQRVDHDVADQVNAAGGNAFARKVPVSVFGGSEQQIGDLIGEHAIDLLRHAAVQRAQSGFHVSHGDAEFGAHQRGGDGRIHVAIDHDQRRLRLRYDGLEVADDGGGLLRMRARAGLQVEVGHGHRQLLEEDVGHVDVVMLSGVNQDLAHEGISGKGANEGRRLHEVGPRAYDVTDRDRHT